MEDLAPGICRQRHVIEFVPAEPVTGPRIRDYLGRLGEELGMIILAEPTTSLASKFGWSGWVHWTTSGAHFYAWDRPVLFASVDIYTCKPFSPAVAVAFTASYFDAQSITDLAF